MLRARLWSVADRKAAGDPAADRPPHPGKQLIWLDFEATGEFHDGVEPWNAHPALQFADLGSVQRSKIGQLFLGEARAPAGSFQVATELLAESEVGHRRLPSLP